MVNLKTYDLPEIDLQYGEIFMPGSIVAIPITMSTPPGWLVCDSTNNSLNTYTYRRLHSVISNTYGGTAYSAGITDQTGAVTTFSVPIIVGLNAQPVPIPANVTNTLISNTYHSHTLAASSNLDAVNLNHAGNISGSIPSTGTGPTPHGHSQVQALTTGGPSSNTPRRIGGTDGVIAHESHTHYAETTYNASSDINAGSSHGHGVTVSVSNSPTNHSHTSNVSSSNISSSTQMPQSHYVKYIIKV